jgi:AAA15 family ATPase/GTPase
MIKSISIRNFLSFKELTDISFESSNYWLKKDNVFNIDISSSKKTTLMKSMVIYWANASWKSNILRALVVIKAFAMRSNFSYTPFLLDDTNRKKTSFFEICFFVWDKQYKYNFELLGPQVISENLFEIKNSDELILFKRQEQDIKVDNEFIKYKWQLEDKVKNNASFIWVLDQFNWKLNNKSILHFFDSLNSLWSGYNGEQTIDLLKLTENEDNKKFALEFLKCSDIDICDIRIQETMWKVIDLNMEKEDVKFSQSKSLQIELGHSIKWTNNIEYFPLQIESQWTQKLFWILWMVITTIINEWILCFDEIENNLHPHIVKNLLKLIHSDLWKRYQFIFTSHSLELMNLKEFKKEQIWITEKNRDGATTFYSLYDFEDIRSENDIQKLYNLWALGWIPLTRDFSSLLKEAKLWGVKKD